MLRLFARLFGPRQPKLNVEYLLSQHPSAAELAEMDRWDLADTIEDFRRTRSDVDGRP